jgi:hypothetical protein
VATIALLVLEITTDRVESASAFVVEVALGRIEESVQSLANDALRPLGVSVWLRGKAG